MTIIKAVKGSEMMVAAFNIANSTKEFLRRVPLEKDFPYNYHSLIDVNTVLIDLMITFG